MSKLTVANLRKTFNNDVVAVDDVSFSTEEGEVLSLVGPSGCGKTTTLRAIGGFEEVDSGQVLLNGEDITRRPIHKRNIGFCFQSYALFPHLTVDENIAFGLRFRKVSRNEVKARTRRGLDLVRLSGMGERYPRQLSGGQQQRVALARALAIEPSVLLLDEPLSNLDAHLREEMRIEIKRIQRAVGITTIFVTHDQEEALAISDRIVVMDKGRIAQIGAPAAIYERPEHPFVAGFVGQANVIRGTVLSSGDGVVSFRTATGHVLRGRGGPMQPGTAVIGAIKHERMRIGDAAPDLVSLSGTVEVMVYLGHRIQYVCTAGGERLGVNIRNDHDSPVYKSGEPVTLAWRIEDCVVLEAGQGNAMPAVSHPAAGTVPAEKVLP
jgi:putative spermidine/putrescine transport system ATP-binding protein